MSNETQYWQETVENKVKLIHDQISSLKVWSDENDSNVEILNELVKPYYKLLETVYLEEFPLANAIDNSDLVLKLEGPNLDLSNPRLSLISGVFNNVRKQVTNLTKAIADIAHITKGLPKELDLGLSAVAKGSVILGFTVPSDELLDKESQINLLGEEDPLYKATKEAIKTLGIVSEFVAEEFNYDAIENEIEDPKIRDTALVAIKNISPSGRTEVKRVGLVGKSFSKERINFLTSDSRKELRRILKEPVKSQEVQSFEGIMREIDLDARRFDLRRIVRAEIEDIRCIYSLDFDTLANKSLNKKLKVIGRLERSAQGKPRLLFIQEMKIIK